MDVLGYPGLPGLFVACLYSGALRWVLCDGHDWISQTSGEGGGCLWSVSTVAPSGKYYVKDVLGYPGLPGLFLACLFSCTLRWVLCDGCGWVLQLLGVFIWCLYSSAPRWVLCDGCDRVSRTSGGVIVACFCSSTLRWVPCDWFCGMSLLWYPQVSTM